MRETDFPVLWCFRETGGSACFAPNSKKTKNGLRQQTIFESGHTVEQRQQQLQQLQQNLQRQQRQRR